MATTTNRTKSALGVLKIIIQIIWNILLYTIIIIGVFRISGVVYDFSYEIFGNVTVDSLPGKDMPIEIRSGEGTKELAQKLENMGIIVNKNTFFVRAKLSIGSRKPILPGSYRLNTSMTYEEIISVITNESTVQME
ncbi:MAG: endolytic transglycosylase MltG [Acetivibrio sp.]